MTKRESPFCECIHWEREAHFKRYGKYPQSLVLSNEYAEMLWKELHPYILSKAEYKFENPVNGIRQVMGMNCLVLTMSVGGNFKWGFAE